VDGSANMLAVAKAKVPGGDFCQGDLRALPVGNQEVDLVTISLALTHVPELAPVLAEFARVLRPGGHLVIADSRMDYPMVQAMPDGMRQPAASLPRPRRPPCAAGSLTTP
jgi:ubiquinone/menaquinone biosynthesis C-methylase UbiE